MLGQYPPSHSFIAANYAQPGCENVLPDQGQSRGEESTLPININTDILAAGPPAVQNPH